MQLTGQYKAHCSWHVQQRASVHIGLQAMNVSLLVTLRKDTESYEESIMLRSRKLEKKKPGDYAIDSINKSFPISPYSPANFADSLKRHQRLPKPKYVTHLYVEHFDWIKVDDLEKLYISSLKKGLPYTILSILESFQTRSGPFNWGFTYRNAGHYAWFLLYYSTLLWMASNLLFCVVTMYGVYACGLAGIMLLTTIVVYSLQVPTHSILFADASVLELDFGWNFILLWISGEKRVWVFSTAQNFTFAVCPTVIHFL